MATYEGQSPVPSKWSNETKCMVIGVTPCRNTRAGCILGPSGSHSNFHSMESSTSLGSSDSQSSQQGGLPSLPGFQWCSPGQQSQPESNQLALQGMQPSSAIPQQAPPSHMLALRDTPETKLEQSGQQPSPPEQPREPQPKLQPQQPQPQPQQSPGVMTNGFRKHAGSVQGPSMSGLTSKITGMLAQAPDGPALQTQNDDPPKEAGVAQQPAGAAPQVGRPGARQQETLQGAIGKAP